MECVIVLLLWWWRWRAHKLILIFHGDGAGGRWRLVRGTRDSKKVRQRVSCSWVNHMT
jgi:hypothetical protein